MTQYLLKQWFFTKVSSESKSKWANGKEISYKNMSFFASSSCSLWNSRKCEIKMEALSILTRKIMFFITADIWKSPMLGSSRQPIDKAGLTTLFSSEDAFPSVSLPANFY